MRLPTTRLRVLAHYVVHPEATNGEVARATHAQPQNIMAARKWLMEHGFIQCVRIHRNKEQRAPLSVQTITETGWQWLLASIAIDASTRDAGNGLRSSMDTAALDIRDHVEDFIARNASVAIRRMVGARRQKDRYLSDGTWTNQCTLCGLGPEWQGKPLTLEVDHIDGNRSNNAPENLRLLCPNCHAQTPTFRRRKRVKEEDDMRINSPLEEIPADLAPKLIAPKPHEVFLRAFSERYEKALGARYSAHGEDYRHAKNLVRAIAPDALRLMLDTFFAMDMYEGRDLKMPPLRRFWFLRDELLANATAKVREREHKAAETPRDREAIEASRRQQEELYAKLARQED